ncbi:MAG: hypothetical protein ACR2NW_07325 [Thermodesulfobacteriota bacterium]
MIRKNILLVFFVLCLFYVFGTLTVFADLDSETESIDSVSESADQISENVGSDVKPTESLEEASEPIGEVSEEPTESPDVVENESQTPQEKPLGVREAEGKVIGE